MNWNDATTASPVDFLVGRPFMQPLLPKPLIRETLLVTRQGMQKLRDQCEFKEFNSNVSLNGIEVREVDFPLKKRIVKSLDRFAEYDEKDMVWAEPAGLAKWVEVDVEVMMLRVREKFERLFFAESV